MALVGYVKTAVAEGIEGEQLDEVMERGLKKAEEFREEERWKEEVEVVEIARSIIEIANDDSEGEGEEGGDEECRRYLESCASSQTPSPEPLNLKNLYDAILTNTCMSNEPFVNAVYVRSARDVFWGRNIEKIVPLLGEEISEQDAIKTMFKIIAATGGRWGGVRRVVEGIVKRGKSQEEKEMTSLMEDVIRNVEEEGRTEYAALVGFIMAKTVGPVVREVTKTLEEKSKGTMRACGEDWREVERLARRRVLMGGRSIYERIAREEIGWGEDCSHSDLELKARNWSSGSSIRQAHDSYGSECDWLEANWSIVWDDTQGGTKTSTRHFLSRDLLASLGVDTRGPGDGKGDVCVGLPEARC